MIVVEFSIVPIGEGISVSRFLVPAFKELEKRGVKYEVTPMCTVFESESVEEAFEIVRSAHEAVFKTGVKRLVTTVKLDDRRDKERRMEEKVETVKALLGEAR